MSASQCPRLCRALIAALALCVVLPVQAALSLDQVRLIDPERGHVSAPRCLRIETGRITHVAPAGDTRCRAASDVHELPGRYVTPGLIDMHAHLTLGPLEFRKVRGLTKMAALADDDIAQHNARLLLAFGITTIRNPGGDLAAAQRYAQWRARHAGPESFDAGPVINDALIEGLSVAVRTREDVQRAVAAQIAQGADWIKLYTGLSPDLLKAGIDAAHAHGRPAVAHLDDIAWPDALAMELDGLVHLMPTSPDLLTKDARAAWQAQRRLGTYEFFEWWEHFDPDGAQADRVIAAFDRHRPVFDATLIAFHAAFVQDQDNAYRDDTARYAHPRLRQNWQDWFTFAVGWEPSDFRRARAIWPRVQRFAQRVYASRARVTVGTDMSNPWIAPGISLHREMALLADAGVPASRILQAATTNAAHALGVDARVGQLRPGFEADLLVLERNPLEDIRHTQSIHAVVNDGHFLPSTQLASLKGE